MTTKMMWSLAMFILEITTAETDEPSLQTTHKLLWYIKSHTHMFTTKTGTTMLATDDQKPKASVKRAQNHKITRSQT
jgi:hypothetical protein